MKNPYEEAGLMTFKPIEIPEEAKEVFKATDNSAGWGQEVEVESVSLRPSVDLKQDSGRQSMGGEAEGKQGK
jgi:hypothetical protein